MSKYDRVMRKVNNFYAHPKKEELYNLNVSIIDYLLPRLKLFIVDSSSIVDWDWHKRNNNIDIIKSLRLIIRDLEYIKEHQYDFDVKIAEKCMRKSKSAFSLLGEIYFYLWD